MSPSKDIDQETLVKTIKRQPPTLEQIYADRNAELAALDEHAVAIRELGRKSVEQILEIGRHLKEAKDLAGHGGFKSWLEREFGWSIKTAQRFMNIHELAESKNDKLSLLGLPVSALYLLAAPSTPEVVRDDVLESAKAGEPPTIAGIKQAIAESKAPGAGSPRSRSPPPTMLIPRIPPPP
jgi:Protein of unknown function (DUF3102)